MRRPLVLVVLLVIALAGGELPPRAALAGEPPTDWDLTTLDGHFYRQVAGKGDLGFVVSNEQGVPFWDIYRQYGPVGLGYPISQRFDWDSRITQVFQRGALWWNPNVESVEVVPLLDQLHELGLDDQLEAEYGIPAEEPSAELPAGETLIETANLRAELLKQDPRLAAYYLTLPDPLYLLGMPTSAVRQLGGVRAVRTERGALQVALWDRPGARAGEVVTAPVGSIAAELGVFPDGGHWQAIPPPEPPPAEPVFDDGTALDPATVRVPAGRRWIDVDMARQKIYAMVDDTPVYWAPAAFGRPGYETPTGRFRINRRVFDETMNSATVGIPRGSPEYYFFTNVYYTQYFDALGDAIHTNYWQPVSVFGTRPTTHGCVGLFYKDAEFFWSFAQIGTQIVIH